MHNSDLKVTENRSTSTLKTVCSPDSAVGEGEQPCLLFLAVIVGWLETGAFVGPQPDNNAPLFTCHRVQHSVGDKLNLIFLFVLSFFFFKPSPLRQLQIYLYTDSLALQVLLRVQSPVFYLFIYFRGSVRSQCS